MGVSCQTQCDWGSRIHSFPSGGMRPVALSCSQRGRGRRQGQGDSPLPPWGKVAFTFRKGFSILACPCARTVREHPEKGDDKMKKPRLTDADRLAIETGLRSGKTACGIAKELSRPVTTVTREIWARAVESDKGAAYRVTNRCAFRMECQRRGVCVRCLHDGKRQCRFCRQCDPHCPAFVEQRCGRLERSPFVCNGCAEERTCVLRKRHCLRFKKPASTIFRTIVGSPIDIASCDLLATKVNARSCATRGQEGHGASNVVLGILKPLVLVVDGEWANRNACKWHVP